jgi:alkylhydroperoxidase/carboxymuconolactone decarboxylase family protein YurZ
MHLPKIYQYFTDNFPKISRDFNQLGKTYRESGSLKLKIQNLINLGIATGATSRGAVMPQTRKALESGATQEEILHVALLALTTIGFPNMIAAMGWINEVLEKELP